MVDADTGVAPVVILGSGGHALVIWDVLESAGGYELLGFTDPFLPAGHLRHLGSVARPVLGDDAVLPALVSAHPDLQMIAGVGPEPDHVRGGMVETIEALGAARALTVCHSSAIISRSARIGRGSVVMAGAVINPGASIGNHCVVNTGATVDHECEVGDGVFIQPGVHVGGRVVLEDGVVVGIGAGIRDKVHVGRGAYIGGGAFVHRDVPDGAVVVGVPARVLRFRFGEPSVAAGARRVDPARGD
jgi:sugar O-acyltransferase (sialic acid O-acetyltransferase NeuD family)